MNINNGNESVYISQSKLSNITVNDDTITLKQFSSDFFNSKSQENWTPDLFKQMYLLNKTLSFTTDLSQALDPSCNAAVFLLAMPVYNKSQQPYPIRKGNYFCDAANLTGIPCPELDIIEASVHGMLTTLHPCVGPPIGKNYGNCSVGCGIDLVKNQTGSYGSGNRYTINTQIKFDVKFSFRVTADQ